MILSEHLNRAKLLFFGGGPIVCSSDQQKEHLKNKSNVPTFLSQTQAQEVLRLCRKGEKKDFDGVQCPWGPRSLFQPQHSYCNHHHSKHATLLCRYTSSSSVLPLPPTGHPEACWNTMPVLAQAPTSGPNVEVTSSGKNGIVSLENHNTVGILVTCNVLRRINV